ncbi:MAG: hypothetical protein C4334_13160 [Pyrinomonas sp.]|uniref:TonB-dependent receptor n=1 Tax=Pyrinomonas sp. TaxID=2080306 RepID=UPI003328F780
MRLKALLALSLVCALFLFPLVHAQSNTGRLVGTVSGPDGVIAGATVTLTDVKTGRERSTVTTGEGNFIFPQLEVGTYTVRITAPGFKTFTATDVKIDVAREYSLNVTLEVGGVQESVTVVAGADILNATSGELSNTVSPRQVVELPLNGRNPLQLIQLQPGVAANGATSTTINGQRTSFTNITRDGLNVQDNFIRANATDFVPDRPNVDDTGEFTVITQNAGADAGYGASQVQLVTPRGGSEFHGAAFIYNRNSKFAANSFFNNLAGTPRPFLNRNQFGGKLSGPLYLPRFGEGGPVLYKGKTFFFAAYEGFRLRQSATVARTILLPQARQGIFTYRDNSGTVRSVNILQLAGLSGIDPLVQSRILANLPTVGNRTDIGDQLNTTGFGFTQKQNQNREAFTLRIDADLNERHTIGGVYSYRKEFLLRPDVDNTGNAGFSDIPASFQDSHNHSLSLTYRYTPGANFTNEVRGGVRDDKPRFDNARQPQGFFIAVPLISNPEVNFQAQGRNVRYYNLQDNAVYTVGQHSIRFGGQLQVFRINPYGPPAFSNSTLPTYVLGTNNNTPALSASQFPGGISATQLNNANSLLALLGGIIGSANLTFNATSKNSGYVPGAIPQRNLNFEHYSFYAADQWRPIPQLTLNYGLRYELYTPIREPNGLALEPVIQPGQNVITAILDPNGIYDFVGRNAGGDNKFFKADKNNFAPVVSFAYTPQFKNRLLGSIFPGEGRTVIRGGFRMSYVNDEFVRAADNALGGNQGLTQQVTLANINARFSSLPGFTTPTFQVPRTYAQNNLLAGRFGTVFAIDPDLQVPRWMEYSFGIQREIGFQTAIEIRYVGGRSDNLVRGRDLNQVDIFGNGFVQDFLRARNNLLLTGNPACTPAQNPGCQTLTVFPNLGAGGLLSNTTVQTQLRNGTPADLAILYITNGLTGNVRFLPNPNTGVADVLDNSGISRYNSLQVEVRRRLSQGFFFQANYTFQKTLTDAPGVGQTRFDPLLDNNQPRLEYARADYDQTHVFNFNTIYELPIGRGRRFLDQGGIVNFLLGGWQFSSIIRAATGAPVTITDPRGTLNRAARSGRQTAVSSLSKDEIKNLIGVRRTPCGVFFIDPRVINLNQANLQSGLCSQLGSGRAAEGFGTTPFSGQVFFNAAPGQTGNLERAFINGPFIFSWDASLLKNFALRETLRFQLRVEAFNVINRANFFVNQFTGLNINSPNFGRITSTVTAPRVIQLVGRIEF